MEHLKIQKKIKHKLWQKIVRVTYNKPFYHKIYKSYWHKYFSQSREGNSNRNYFTATPNPYAGIGHQLANWIAGYWFAKQFNLTFTHIPFSNEKWENLLSFGEDEISMHELVSKYGYKKVRIPLFDELNHNDLDLIKKIIKSYNDQKVVFVAEQDQFYHDQYRVIDELKSKFYQAKSRSNDNIIFSDHYYNIAMHVRRGDIITKDNNPNLVMRWQDNTYFEKVLSNILDYVQTDKPIAIYLFSQGEEDEFISFKKFNNINFCLDMGAQASFLHMVYADLLITSKSSFSYKPALLNEGIKVCPRNFWHGYPEAEDWILAEEDGSFDANLIAFKS